MKVLYSESDFLKEFLNKVNLYHWWTELGKWGEDFANHYSTCHIYLERPVLSIYHANKKCAFLLKS